MSCAVPRPLSLNGVTLPREQWSLRLGESPDLVSRRLKLGWPLEDALTLPAGSKRRWPRNVLQMRKICSTCWRRLLKKYFDRDRTMPDGRKYQCRACRRARVADLLAGAPRLKPWESRRA